MLHDLPSTFKPHISKCKVICAKTYDALSAREQTAIDDLLDQLPILYNVFEEYAPMVTAYVKNITPEKVMQLMQYATKVLKDKKTVKFIHHYIDEYGEIIKSPKHMKAIGAYLKCIVSHIDPKYKSLVLQGVDLVFALVALVNDNKVVSFVEEITDGVKKHIVKPVTKAVKPVRKSKQ